MRFLDLWDTLATRSTMSDALRTLDTGAACLLAVGA
jgi:hypothetical protein